MAVQITIREVPTSVRDELAARAAASGMSMQRYLRKELERLAERPSAEQWLERTRRRKQAAGRQLSAREILHHPPQTVDERRRGRVGPRVCICQFAFPTEEVCGGCHQRAYDACPP